MLTSLEDPRRGEREVDLVVDGGRAEVGMSSTVVELIPHNKEGQVPHIKIIREGAIKAEQVLRVIKGGEN